MLQNLNPYEWAEVELILSKPDRRTLTLENYIFVVGAHQKIVTLKEAGADPFLPDFQDRDLVRKQYVKSITPIKVLQGVEIDKAETSGLIDQLIKMKYLRDLKVKVSYLHGVASKLGLIDLNNVGKATKYLQLQGGGFRTSSL